MAKVNWGKIAVIVLPTLAVGGLIYWVIKKYGSTPAQTYVSNGSPTAASPNGSVAVPIKTAPPANPNFPLKSGSNNSSVKQLQTALGVTADGIFGPVTLAALQNIFGISSVPDANTLNAIINAPTNRTPALSKENQFEQGGVAIYMNEDTFADEVNEDSSGNLTPTGLGFQMSQGQTYDPAVYTINGVTAMGLLIVKVLSGPLIGEYTVDPSAVNLIVPPAAPAVSLLPVTDPNTGATTFDI